MVNSKCVVYLYYNNKTKQLKIKIMTTIKNTLNKLDLTEKIGLSFVGLVILPLLTFIVVNMINGNFTQF